MTKQQLIEDNMNLVYFVIRTNFPSYINDEDIIQTGMLGLCYAADKWDADKSEFSTYAYRAIRGHICKEFRTRNEANNNGVKVISLDYELNNDEGDSATLGELLVGESDVDFFDMSELYERVSPLDREILRLRKQGLSNVQIGKQVGRSSERINQRLRRLRRIYNEIYGGTDG